MEVINVQNDDNALLKPSINGTANVLNYFNKDIAAGIFNFLLRFF